MPRFNHRPGRKRDYLRGFGAQFWNTGASAGGAHGGSELIPGFGAALKKEIKRRHPAWFEIHPYGEVLPYAHNRITVDPNRKDRYGVPLPAIDYRIGENERKMAEHMATPPRRSSRRPAACSSATSAATSIATAPRSTSTAPAAWVRIRSAPR